MAYSLTIERPDNPITLDEWRAAIDSTEGIRLATSDTHTTQSPATGAVIGLKAVEGDAEIFDQEDGQWHWAVTWHARRGTASFNARIVGRATSFNDLSDSIWTCLSTVAKKLTARIRGEEGEVFNLDTAKLTKG